MPRQQSNGYQLLDIFKSHAQELVRDKNEKAPRDGGDPVGGIGLEVHVLTIIQAKEDG